MYSIVEDNRGGKKNLRRRILKLLYEENGKYISGEELSQRFQVSRTAIWKHINALKEEGYGIESTHKKGYRLMETSDKLIPEVLERNLDTNEIGKKIIYFHTIGSTNIYAKEIAREVPHGTVIISEEQTSGRGRLGRDWISPKGEGIWMTIILKPDIPPTEGMKMTQIAAAAVVRAIKKMTHLEVLIKWPNDVVFEGKKVCGILTEMAGELNKMDYLIVGIGINANNQSFPQELQAMATSLALHMGKAIDRQNLIIHILEEFEKLYLDYIREGNLQKTLEIVRDYSAILGRSIYVIKGKEKFKAKVLEINDVGLLKIRHEDGREELLFSGEVSIRGEKGYI